MSRTVAIVGAGMGGLTSALRLAKQGFRVHVLDARASAGGLASGFEQEGLSFDGGPYILLDRNGLDWAFGALGLRLEDHLSLARLEHVYEVAFAGGERVGFHSSLQETAAGIERSWPGAGPRYERFIRSISHVYSRLRPLLSMAHPGPLALLRAKALFQAPFLLKTLGDVLRQANLPQPLMDALAIWTHVANQRVEEAPSPMAFVPALIHGVGSYYPVGGIGTIPRALSKLAAEAGVEFHFNSRVRAIRTDGQRATGVETSAGELIAADAVISDYSGVGTYLELLAATPKKARERLERMPLQSPGVCAYLAVKGSHRPPYLRFELPGDGETCRLFIAPEVMDPSLGVDGWWPARLLSPMDHAQAARMGPKGQQAHLDRLLAEPWWRQHVSDFRVVATRIPAQWGSQFHLYRDSMNPSMTARFMRQGRIAHRSPHVRGLYLTGSSTHPGQWVSFCAISGVLSANLVVQDLA